MRNNFVRVGVLRICPQGLEPKHVAYGLGHVFLGPASMSLVALALSRSLGYFDVVPSDVHKSFELFLGRNLD
jgi:hypothetical protein